MILARGSGIEGACLAILLCNFTVSCPISPGLYYIPLIIFGSLGDAAVDQMQGATLGLFQLYFYGI